LAAVAFSHAFWYELRWLGLENVCVLDGGMTAWKEENLPVTDKPTEPLKDGKIPELEPLEVPVPMETVQDNLKTKEYLEVEASGAHTKSVLQSRGRPDHKEQPDDRDGCRNIS